MVEKTCELVERAKTIPDPRRQCQNLKHRLEDILVLGFCGVLAGCDDFVEIAAWANQNNTFFRTFLELPNGIPSHDTFNRVFTLVPTTTLQEVLLPWLLQRRGLPGIGFTLMAKPCVTHATTGKDWRPCTWSVPGRARRASRWAKWL